ncbi:hypothetical protein [Phenylobacterium sp.]|uniref:hypothetical protein n=1 Tax=Phenylobacterium sp. TaxID=1871053 RepID=UPI0025EF0587|nr:hypothetical protein [Phenylobacterium sp.]
MLRKTLVLTLAGLSLAGCGGAAPKGAAETASRLLAAALKNDRVAFEAEIDRAAVREDVRRQVAEMARSSALDVDGGPSEFALDRMISPDAVRVVDAQGRRLTHAPSAGEVAPLMKPAAGSRVCLRDAQTRNDCLLTFAKEERRWRLVGMKARDLQVQMASVAE